MSGGKLLFARRESDLAALMICSTLPNGHCHKDSCKDSTCCNSECSKRRDSCNKLSSFITLVFRHITDSNNIYLIHGGRRETTSKQETKDQTTFLKSPSMSPSNDSYQLKKRQVIQEIYSRLVGLGSLWQTLYLLHRLAMPSS
jgi:hypothetical protein